MQDIRHIRVSQPVYVYHHTHWDREWYLPFREYQHRLLKVVDTLLDVLDNNQLPCFTLDGQTVVLEDYLAFRPEQRSRLQNLIAQNRLSVGPWYVMPDEFLVSGESLIRNLQRGLALSKQFGETTFTGYLPDTFGHSADIPMLLQQFGIGTAIVWRGVNPPCPWFYWISPSGDKVLTYHLTEGYFQNAFHMEPESDKQFELVESWLNKMSQLSGERENAPLLLPVGADHLGVVPESDRRLKAWVPQAQTITLDAFMIQAQDAHIKNLPEVKGELRTPHGIAYLLPGVFSSRMYLKQWSRRLEWRLTRQLEPLLVWQKLLGHHPAYREELDFLWKTLLLNHPHDSICGCSVDSVHRENENRFEQIHQLSTAMIRDAHHGLRQSLQPDGSLLILNLGTTPYTGVVELLGEYPLSDPVPPPPENSQVLSEEIVLDETFLVDTQVLPLSENKMLRRHTLVWAENIPPLGVQALPQGLPAPDCVQVTPTSLKNNHLEVTVTPEGTLTVTCLKTGRISPSLHGLWRNPEQGDSYNAAPAPGSASEMARLEGSDIIYSGPLRGTLELKWRFPSIDMTVETRISLDAGSSRLDFNTRFVNPVPDHKIQVTFETSTPITQVVAEGHFSPVTRTYDPQYRIEAHMPAPRLTELVVQGGPIQRFIGFDRQTLITEGLTEYEVQGSTLKLTLHRGFGMLSRDDTGVRGSHAGPPLPTPEGQCIGRLFDMRYAWLPDFDVPSAYAAADWFYGAVCGFDRKTEAKPQTALQSRSFVSWDNPLVPMTALVPTCDGFELRLLNPTSTPQPVTLQLPGQVKSVQCVSLQAEPQETLYDNRLIIPPCRIQTLAVRVQ